MGTSAHTGRMATVDRLLAGLVSSECCGTLSPEPAETPIIDWLSNSVWRGLLFLPTSSPHSPPTPLVLPSHSPLCLPFVPQSTASHGSELGEHHTDAVVPDTQFHLGCCCLLRLCQYPSLWALTSVRPIMQFCCCCSFLRLDLTQLRVKSLKSCLLHPTSRRWDNRHVAPYPATN